MIFIDTGAFLARHLKGDQYHKKSLKLWATLEKKGLRCATSNAVLYETLTLMGRRASYSFAAERARHIYASRSLAIWYPAPEDEQAAIGYFEKFSDQKVSFVDCLSFALLKRHGVGNVFTFDRHFALAGFSLLTSP